MARLTIGHIGLHVRDIEEEVEFLETLGGELIGIDPYPTGRLESVRGQTQSAKARCDS